MAMIAEQLTRSILRRYLWGLPHTRRLSRYQQMRAVAWLTPILEELRPEILPVAPVAESSASAAPTLIRAPVSHYHQYRCVQGSPLSCSEIVKSNSASCDRCQFPGWLPLDGQLVGKQGSYHIERRLERRGMGRLYAAIRRGSEEPVVIKEYLLPARYFSPEEQQQYQEAFTNLAGLSLADGRRQALRIVVPLEAIADPAGDRCYSISPTIYRHLTLNQHCAQQGPLSDQTTASVLNQVLQTLSCLHEQKFSLPAGQTQTGIVHGNLNADSLLWVENSTANSHSPNSYGSHSSGFVYLTDFALWENLFNPALSSREPLDYQQDLSALGEVAFRLLNGTATGSHNQPLNPRLESDWPTRTNHFLKLFILRLIGIEPPFASAEAARMALLKLLPEPAVSQHEHRLAETVPVKKDWYKRGILPVVVTAAILILGTAGWLLLRSKRPIYAEAPLLPCCLDTISAVPAGDYVHSSPESAYWYPLFRTSPNLSNIAVPTLFDRLKETYPDLTIRAKAASSVEETISHIRSGQSEFAIIPLTFPLPLDLAATVIAYDSLVPVVAFSYPDRARGLPNELDGEISLKQLKQIYAGPIDRWQQLGASSLPLKRYWPSDPTVQAIFEQRVLSDPTVDSAFSAFQDQHSNPDSLVNPTEAGTQSTLLMMRSILQDFENSAIGSIGIAPLSQVVGQCSVYPLALSIGGKTVSPLIFENGKGVNPQSDLCDRKGSYHPHSAAIRSGDYPLAYPLAIIYPFDNTRSDIGKKLAELLLTQESQQLLESSGLVPAYRGEQSR